MIKKSFHPGVHALHSSSVAAAVNNINTKKVSKNYNTNLNDIMLSQHNHNKSGLFVSPLAMAMTREKISKENYSAMPRPFSTIISNYASQIRRRQTVNNNSINNNSVTNAHNTKQRFRDKDKEKEKDKNKDRDKRQLEALNQTLGTILENSKQDFSSSNPIPTTNTNTVFSSSQSKAANNNNKTKKITMGPEYSPSAISAAPGRSAMSSLSVQRIKSDKIISENDASSSSLRPSQSHKSKKSKKESKIFRGFHRRLGKRRSENFESMSSAIASVKTGNKTLKEKLMATKLRVMAGENASLLNAPKNAASSNFLKSMQSNNNNKTPLKLKLSASQYPLSTAYARDQEFRALYGRLKVHYILQDETCKNLSVPEKLTRVIKNLELFERELVEYLSHPGALPQAKIVLKDLRSRRADMMTKLKSFPSYTKELKGTAFPSFYGNPSEKSKSKDNNNLNPVQTSQTISTISPPYNDNPGTGNEPTTTDDADPLQHEHFTFPRIKMNSQPNQNEDVLPPSTLSKEGTKTRKRVSKRAFRKSSNLSSMVNPNFAHVKSRYLQPSPMQLLQQQQQQADSNKYNDTNRDSTDKENDIKENGGIAFNSTGTKTSEVKVKRSGGFPSKLRAKWKKSDFIKLLPHPGEIPKNVSRMMSEPPDYIVQSSSTGNSIKSPLLNKNNNSANGKGNHPRSFPNPNQTDQPWPPPSPPNKTYMGWLEEMMATKLVDDVKNGRGGDALKNINSINLNNSTNSNPSSKPQPNAHPPRKWGAVPTNLNRQKDKKLLFSKELIASLTEASKHYAEEPSVAGHNLHPPTNPNPDGGGNISSIVNQQYISPFEVKGGTVNNFSLGRQHIFPVPTLVNPFPDLNFTFHPPTSVVEANQSFQAVSNTIKAVLENRVGLPILNSNHHHTLNQNQIQNLNQNHEDKNINDNSYSVKYEQPKQGPRSAKVVNDPQSLGLHVPRFVHPKTAPGLPVTVPALPTSGNAENHKTHVSTLFSLKEPGLLHGTKIDEESTEEISIPKKNKSKDHLNVLTSHNHAKYSQPRDLIPIMSLPPATALPALPEVPVSAPPHTHSRSPRYHNQQHNNHKVDSMKSNLLMNQENLFVPQNQPSKSDSNFVKASLANHGHEHEIKESGQSFVGTSQYLQPRNYHRESLKVNIQNQNTGQNFQSTLINHSHNTYSNLPKTADNNVSMLDHRENIPMPTPQHQFFNNSPHKRKNAENI